MNINIKTIKNYPDDGRHQECHIDFPFQIRKGADGYCYRDGKGIEKKYNMYKSEDKIDDRWIVHLKENCTDSLEEIFEIKCHKDLHVILTYCIKLYKKSLAIEQKRINSFEEQILNK